MIQCYPYRVQKLYRPDFVFLRYSQAELKVMFRKEKEEKKKKKI
jgi:hypothetical protein